MGRSDEYDASLVGDEDVPFYTTLVHSCGYTFSIWPNLIMIVILFAIVLLIWVATVGLDFGRRARGISSRKSEPWMTNFMVRFLYEIFFEICLCLMINASYVDIDSDSSGSDTVSWLICIALAALAFVALVMISFTCCCNGGPHVKGVYQRKTLLPSFWGHRPLSQELAENAIKLKLKVDGRQQV